MIRKLIRLSMIVALLAVSPLSALAGPIALPGADSQQASVIMAPAATLTVNTASDENDGSCSDGDCSLRDAIAAASPGDTIDFAGDYTITLGSTLVVSTSLTIDGGEQAVTVSGNDAVRVFNINTDTHVTIDSLTIAHGKIITPDFYGYYPAGGGMKIEPGAEVTLTHSAVLSNTAVYYASDLDLYMGMGGGIFNQGTLTAIDTSFTGNAAGNIAEYGDSYGGAIFNNTNALTIVDSSTFTGNDASMGGAIRNRGSSTLTVQNSLFTNNSAPCGGAGISSSGFATVSDSTISDNVAPDEWCEGDAAGIGNTGIMTVTHSIISGNVSEGYYGGLSNYDGSLIVIDSAIHDNVAGDHGGGIYNWWGADLTVINSEIYSNTAGWWGGGIFSGPDGGASLTLVNSALFGNQAEKGGGIYNGAPWDASGAALTMVNSTVFSNTASLEGGGIYNKQATPNLSNSIIWGNSAAVGSQIYNYTTALTPTIRYSDIEGSGGSGVLWDTNLGFDGGGNLDSDPLFVDADGADGLIGTGDDDLRLADGSPAIDAADNTAVPADTYDLDSDGNTTEPAPYDLDGAERFQDNIITDTGNGAAPIVDMGAYEAPKVVDAGLDQSVMEGDLVAFAAATLFTAVEDISWDFGDGTGAVSVLNPSHTFLEDDVYTVTLTVTDTLYGTARDSLLVTVANADPVLGSLSNQTVVEDTPLDISVEFTDLGVLDTHTAQIDWGDGNITAGVVDALNGLVGGSHAYAAPGAYTLVLTIYDDDGGEDALTIQVEVTPSVYKIYLPLTLRQ
ncbi:MAG: CSLREA domain-containing protein [Anaerolineales bacterium]|nr:CSLREA domain-containing protein [Anaerolineales bacterium]